LALRHILTRVVDGAAVDFVHTHGTATQANDPVELAAIKSAIPPGHLVPIYSHKGALGHSLGAAGLVSVVINCIAHDRGIVPPNVRTTSPLPTTNLLIDRHPIHRPIRRSIALAAGFGGAVAAVSLTSR
jgi:3-oxoacyl-(acyl-carrier-protein) synthase